MEMVLVVAAASHSFAVTRIGEVYAFGDNSHGQLGFPPLRGTVGTTLEHQSPDGPGGASLRRGARASRQIDQPQRHTEVVDKLWRPARIVALSKYKVRQMSTGEMHTLALA